MSCYHPMLGVRAEFPNSNGKFEYRILGKYDPIAQQINPGSIAIPCGKCIGCRLDYSRSWADRMMLELDYCKKAVFITLTYAEDNVPYTYDENGEFGWYTLRKRDLQLFFKRLRKHFPGKEIKYYASGEYGSHTFRPHYHAIVFGLSVEDFDDRIIHGRNELGQRHYISPTLEKIWSNGFTMLAEVSWLTCAYVARYVQKKVFQGTQLTDMLGVDPEFSLSSRRPGIGARWLEEHQDCFDLSKVYVTGMPDGMRLPKFILKKLELIDPEKYARIKKEKQEFAKDADFLKALQTDLNFVERLEVEENKKLEQIASLRRL